MTRPKDERLRDYKMLNATSNVDDTKRLLKTYDAHIRGWYRLKWKRIRLNRFFAFENTYSLSVVLFNAYRHW